MSTREELVQAVEDAKRAAWFYPAARDAYAAVNNARQALKAYDKENT